MSTIPNPAGLSDDRGSIVKGPQERSDLSITNLKKQHSLHIIVNQSSSLFFDCPRHPSTQGSEQSRATVYKVQCYQIALNHSIWKEAFSLLRHGLGIIPLESHLEYSGLSMNAFFLSHPQPHLSLSPDLDVPLHSWASLCSSHPFNKPTHSVSVPDCSSGRLS